MIKIYTDTDNTYRFSLNTENGNTLLNSVVFIDKARMEHVIRMLGKISLTRNHFERKTDTEGKFLFNLKDDDGQIVGHSGPYDSEAGMENGINDVRERIKSIVNKL